MEAYRIETSLKKDGTLVLSHLPFHSGESVEVIILSLGKAINHKKSTLSMELAAMAADSQVQRELKRIEQEFSQTELDGLEKV